MRNSCIAAVAAVFLMLASSQNAGAAGGPPGWPPPPLDPCGVHGCPKPREKVCSTTHSHVCVEWQGNPVARCKRYEDQERTVCL